MEMPNTSPSKGRYKKIGKKQKATSIQYRPNAENKDRKLRESTVHNNFEMRSTHYHFNYMHCIILYRNVSLRGSCKTRKRWGSSCMQQNIIVNKDQANIA